jgi:hypothetical protein
LFSGLLSRANTEILFLEKATAFFDLKQNKMCLVQIHCRLLVVYTQAYCKITFDAAAMEKKDFRELGKSVVNVCLEIVLPFIL